MVNQHWVLVEIGMGGDWGVGIEMDHFEGLGDGMLDWGGCVVIGS